MKKIFLMLFMLFAVMFTISTVNGQTKATSMVNNGDTVTNTGTVTLTAKVTNPYDLATFHVVNKKVSGTIAGKTYFYGSNVDEENSYILLDSMINVNTVNYNKKAFTDSPPKYIFYKVATTGSGTMKLTTKGYVVLRR